MIHFVSGRPGAGKSMFGVDIIVQELVHGQRNVVTNLAIRREDMAQALHERYGTSADMCTRLRILEDSEVREFWRYPEIGRTRPLLPKQNSRENEQLTDFTNEENHTGTLFVIDEIHEWFNARGWQNTGRDVLHYMSQHRKLGDDLYCITQAINNVDKQMRSVSQDYIYLRNMGAERYSWFRLPNRVLMQVFLGVPSGQERPMYTTTRPIDVQFLGRCYDTAAGAGVAGTTADTGKRASGINVMWLFAAIVVGLVLLGFLPNLGANAVVSDLTGFGRVQKRETLHVSRQVKHVPEQSQSKIDESVEDVELQGVTSIGTQRSYWLSDGSVLRPGEYFAGGQDWVRTRQGKYLRLHAGLDVR